MNDSPSTTALELQLCDQCGAVQYPHRDVCRSCLSDSLSWQPVAPGGKVQAVAAVTATLTEKFRDQLPVRIASVAMDAGPTAICFARDESIAAGDRVRVAAESSEDEVLLHAYPENNE